MARSGSKKSKWKQQEINRPATEEFRIRIRELLEDFEASDEQEYTFECGMSKQERATLHQMCRRMGMMSKSTGKGDNRRLSAYKSMTTKKKKRFDQNEEESIPSLTLPEEAKNMLQDLFIHHPPDESELCKGALNNYKEASGVAKRKPDSSFNKPSIPKSELAKKVELLATKMTENPELKKIAEDRVKLPIASYKDSITSMLKTHQVVLIAGETGCGKTTQVPQYILDYMWGKGKNCKIVCTQPRRISAISVAERISYERGENVGDTVGYKIRLESKGGQQSSIMFCTNGVLLKLLVGRGANVGRAEAKTKSSKDGIMGITHIIVDEIHERDRFSDFMLAIFRDLLPAYPHLHLILMSATFDAERFSTYFGGCPIVQVPGFTHPVKTFYLEDVLAILKSSKDNHLTIADLSIVEEDSTPLTEDYKNALDESIDLALSSDECDPLVELISSQQTSQVYNYQHSETGISPLMVLAGKGKVGDLYMLLSFGADYSLTDNNGSSALDYAQKENQQECYEILKEHVEKGSSKSAHEEELLENYLSSVNPDLIDTVLIERLLKKICTVSNEGAILVFLPGWDDINRTREKLFASKFFGGSSKFNIISLHSMIPSSEQKKVFKKSPSGVRKIILSTNIAETAVTIDDVVYVIDSGRMKEKSYDPYSNVSTLHSSWISKASAKQREGRAGRCQPGICYHLYSKARVASLLDYQVPEIRRMPIEELCLQVKLLNPECRISDFLQKTLDPPVAETVHNGIIVLQDIGALSQDENLTELGEKLGALPVHPSTSKMLLFSILMNCLDPALTLACSADYREPFILPMAPEEKKKASLAKAELSSLYGGCSDQLAVVAAFECWRHAKSKGKEFQFCSKYYISNNIMLMLEHMRKQLQNELVRVGFIPEDMDSLSKNAQDPGVIRAVLTAGVYPMFGRLLPKRRQDRSVVVETASGAKVRLHPHSLNFGTNFGWSAVVIYDEVTRGDAGMYIKNCSLVGLYPLVFLAMELAVAPGGKEEEEEEVEGSGSEEDDEGEGKGSGGGVGGEDVMSDPEKLVTVVVDRWLMYRATALDVAQIYCLRERLTAAMLFKVKNPESILPAPLAASMHAIAFILSREGLSSITPTDNNPGKFGHVAPSDYLKSLMSGDVSNPRYARNGNRVSNSHRGRGGNAFHPHRPRGGAVRPVGNARPTREFCNQPYNCGPNPDVGQGTGPGVSGNRFNNGGGGPARHQSFKRRRPGNG